jgi:hypothetical protein
MAADAAAERSLERTPDTRFPNKKRLSGDIRRQQRTVAFASASVAKEMPRRSVNSTHQPLRREVRTPVNGFGQPLRSEKCTAADEPTRTRSDRPPSFTLEPYLPPAVLLRVTVS